MYITSDTLDDGLIELYPKLLESKSVVQTTRGETTELLGVQIEIQKPRARLSRTETRGKPFSALGELLWYLSRDNQLEFIERYVPRYRDDSEDGLTIYGGYGPRLFGHHGQNQIQNVINLLKSKSTTRRAVIQLFDAEDIGSVHKEIPCTTTLQFFVRHDQVQLIATMRSNDAYWGLPHDVFCFTMLQEIVAKSIGMDIGPYRHFAGSMHLYTNFRDGAEAFLSEGYQEDIEMPCMPNGDPWPAIAKLLEAEKSVRAGSTVDANALGLDPYWCDLVRMLQVFASTGDDDAIAALRGSMSFERYRPYIQSRYRKK